MELTNYIETLAQAVRNLPLDPIRAALHALASARTERRMVFVAGNGGSAATAGHMVNDLCKLTTEGESPSLRAMSLCEPVALLTAWANDTDYDECFRRPLLALANEGDVLVAISTSGRSENVVAAAQAARSKNMTVIALTGPAGGKLKDLADVWIPAPAPFTGMQEDLHLIINHLWAEALR